MHKVRKPENRHHKQQKQKEMKPDTWTDRWDSRKYSSVFLLQMLYPPPELEETRKNSFVFLLQILSPPPEHEEAKRIRITRKILEPSKKSDRKPSQRKKPSESSENLPNASWIEPIWSLKRHHKRETKPECLMWETKNAKTYPKIWKLRRLRFLSSFPRAKRRAAEERQQRWRTTQERRKQGGSGGVACNESEARTYKSNY